MKVLFVIFSARQSRETPRPSPLLGHNTNYTYVVTYVNLFQSFIEDLDVVWVLQKLPRLCSIEAWWELYKLSKKCQARLGVKKEYDFNDPQKKKPKMYIRLENMEHKLFFFPLIISPPLLKRKYPENPNHEHLKLNTTFTTTTTKQKT